MQDRYAGDIGDYVKLALLRALSPGRRLGVAWYLFPDEGHNSDGKHTAYLKRPDEWRGLDLNLFDALKSVVVEERSVARLETAGVLDASYFSERILAQWEPTAARDPWRDGWFGRLEAKLADCDLIFADPDNGITDDNPIRRRKSDFGKKMPLSEIRSLAYGRPAVIYHHNTRFKGGHDAEVNHWLEQLGPGTLAVRANAWSCRTFFILNPDIETSDRTKAFCARWSKHKVFLHRN